MTIELQNETIQQFNYGVDLRQALLWQYNNAPNLQSLVSQKNDWYAVNQDQFWENWHDDVFNLDTANQFGLLLWGRILGLDLYVNTVTPENKPTFGFAVDDLNFDNSNFTDTDGTSILLPLETQRKALKLRYAQLISSGTVPEANRMLKRIFGDLGESFLLDRHAMVPTYIFNFPLTSDLLYLFDNYDILPRPAGVYSTYYDNTRNYFGFEPNGLNFDNGNFYGGQLT